MFRVGLCICSLDYCLKVKSVLFPMYLMEAKHFDVQQGLGLQGFGS